MGNRYYQNNSRIRKKIKLMKIAFIGLTHLSLVSSIVAASKKFKILIFDKNKKKLAI